MPPKYNAETIARDNAQRNVIPSQQEIEQLLAAGPKRPEKGSYGEAKAMVRQNPEFREAWAVDLRAWRDWIQANPGEAQVYVTAAKVFLSAVDRYTHFLHKGNELAVTCGCDFTAATPDPVRWTGEPMDGLQNPNAWPLTRLLFSFDDRMQLLLGGIDLDAEIKEAEAREAGQPVVPELNLTGRNLALAQDWEAK